MTGVDHRLFPRLRLPVDHRFAHTTSGVDKSMDNLGKDRGQLLNMLGGLAAPRLWRLRIDARCVPLA